jgi:hypothetical protein
VSPYTEAAADLSPCGRYRYRLTRRWPASLLTLPLRVTWIMVNPSTADGTADDPTIRRCVGLSCGWGFTSLAVVNLFAYRATDVRELARTTADVVGPGNDAVIDAEAAAADAVVCAWGATEKLPPRLRWRGAEVARRLLAAGRTLHCAKLTVKGQPQHPLFLPSTRS